jgi:ATP-binding cassette subfamily F protein 3
VAVHYYAQHQLDALDATRTVLEELEAVAPEATHTRLRTILGAFLFSGDSVDKRVGVLSGGEKARLALARMLVRPAALLCLDEPTNHLDLASREVLESALAGFPGTIVFISHDRYFINRIATVVVEVASGVLTNYPGSYDDYLEAKARGVQPTPAAPTPSARPADHRGAPATAGRLPSAATRARPAGAAAEPAGRRPGDGAASAPAPQVRVIRKRGTAEIRELKRRVEDLERQIHALERRIAEIGAMLTNPKLYIDGDRVRAVSRERKEAEERMSGLLREWEDLATSLAGHE